MIKRIYSSQFNRAQSRHRVFLSTVLAAAAIFGSAQQGEAQLIPLLEYKFNETGSSVANTGSNQSAANTLTMKNSAGVTTDLHSASGLGVSGLAGDYAFDNTASTGMGTAGTGGYATGALTSVLSGLESFTISGWFKTAGTAQIADRAYLLSFGSTELYGWSAAAGGLIGATNGGAFPSSGGGKYSDIGTWVFFALTYDATSTTNNVNYYKGTTTGGVTLISTGSSALGKTSAASNSLTLGNVVGANRPFDGYLDNIRVFGSATDASGVLSLAQLEQIRSVDAIPEPSTIAALLLGGAALLGMRSLRSYKA